MNIDFKSFIQKHIDKIGKTEGISSNEIKKIESQFNLQLPSVYKDFLSICGKKTGTILNGYYMDYPSVLDNREDVIYELNFDRDRKASKVKLKDSFFFFAQWQGYNFFFFDCNDKNNKAPAYLFDTEKITLYKESFIDFVMDEGFKALP